MRKEQKPYVRLSKARFTPADTCFQAVRILDHAAEMAIRTGDTDLMFQVADKFVDLASRLGPAEDEEYTEEDDEEEDAKPSFGFAHTPKE